MGAALCFCSIPSRRKADFSGFSPHFSPGAHPQRDPPPLPRHRLAAAVQCHRHARQKPVLGAAQDVLALREADPPRHRPHLPRARVLQGPGQPGPGGALQRHEGNVSPGTAAFWGWGAGFGGEELCWALVPTTSSRHRCLARRNRTFSPRAPYSWSSESIRKGIVEFFGVKTELCSDVMRTS